MEKQQHFSIRKLSIGAASVLIGISFLGVQASTVKADTLQNTSATELTRSKAANEAIEQDIGSNIERDADSNIKQEPTSDIKQDAASNIEQEPVSKADTKQITNDQPNTVQAPAKPVTPKPNSNQQNAAIPEPKPQEPAKTKLQTNGAITSDEVNRTEVAATTLTTTTNKKLSANLLAESKVLSQANDTNGGFDEATWGKLNVNDWQGSVQGDYYQLTDYTGDANHVIVPNEADFAKAGISTSGKQIGVTSSLMHSIFKDKATAQDATVAFSKTDNKMVKAIDNDWNYTWEHDSYRGAKAELSKFDGTNLDVSNVTNMNSILKNNRISDLSSLAGWETDRVTDMDLMFADNQISNLDPLASWKVDRVTDIDGMFMDNRISDISPLANWRVNHVEHMLLIFDGNISSIKTNTVQAKRIINFVYPTGYTGKKQDPVTQIVDVPQKVNIELTTNAPKPSNNILDWVTKTETPGTPDPVYFKDYTVPEIKGLLVPDKTVISKQQADITKPINVTVTYEYAMSTTSKAVESNTNDAFALDPKNGLHEHANVNNNGGYDEDYWGKLNVNDWNYTTNDDTITITGYKGNNSTSLIIPNGADFDLANGQGTRQSNVEISSSVMHDLAKSATRIGLSKTANKKVVASNSIWQDAFGGMTNGPYGYNSDGGIKILNPNLTQMDLHNLDTSNITNMSAMFNGGTNLKTIGDLSEWNTSKVTDMQTMFQRASGLTNIGNLDSWNTNNVRDMSYMFNQASSLANIGNLSKWDTNKVTDMQVMFNLASSLTNIGDLSKWDTRNVTNMNNMFSGTSSLTNIGDLSNWDTSKVTRMDYMFESASSLTNIGDLSNWDTSNVTRMDYMFESASSLTSLDLSNWDTSNVTDMSDMFYKASSLTSLDVSNWDTSNVTRMDYMFCDASSLTNLDVSKWNTSKVTNMSDMFGHASSLTNLDVSKWNTGNVTNMSDMFSEASNLTGLNLSNWNTSKVTDMRGMFSEASNLTGLNLSNWNTSKVTDMSGMFSGTSSLTSLDLSNWNTSKVTDMSLMFTSLLAQNSTSRLVLIIYNPNGWQHAIDFLTFSNYLTNDNVPAVITTNPNILKADDDSSYTIDGQTNTRSAIFDATKSPIAGKALPIYAKGMTNDQLETYASAVIKLYNEKVMQDYQKAHPDKLISYAPTQDMTDPRKLATASFVTVPKEFNLTVHFEDIDPNADKDSDTVKQELAKTVELSGHSGDAADLNQVQLPTNLELSGDLPSATFGDTDSVTIQLKHKLSDELTSKENGVAAARTEVIAPDGTVLIQGGAGVQSFIDQRQDLVTGEMVNVATHWTYGTSSNINVSSDILNKYIEQYNPAILDASMNQSTQGWQNTLSGLRQPLQIKLKDGYTIKSIGNWADWNNNGTYTWEGLKGDPDWNIMKRFTGYDAFKIVPLDQSVHYQFMDNGTQVGSDVIITGKTGETVAPNLPIPENYEVANGTTLPTSYTFDATNPTIQINLKHKLETSVESLPATRTINVHLPNGTTKVYQQIIGYQRDVITDLVTKAVTRGTWTVNDVTSSFTIDGVKQLEHSYVLRNGNYNFAGIKLPKVPGYKAVVKTIANPVNPTSSLFTVSFMALPKPVTLAPNDVEPAKTVTSATTVSTETADLIKTDSKATISVTPKVIDLSNDVVATTPKETVWQVANEPEQDTYRVSNGKYTVELPHISNAQLHVIANNSTKDSVLFTYKGQNIKYVFNIKFVDGHYLLTTYEVKSGKLVKLIDYNFIKASKMSDLIRDWLKL